MSHTPLRSRLPRVHRRVLHALLLAFAFALLAGCTAMPSRSTGDAPPPRSQHPVIAQASALLQVGGQVDGSQIDALLSQLDNATLQAEAAALPVGDPLYNYVGRALLRRGLPLPRPFDRSAWQFDASNRPPAAADGYRPPLRLAVLLPLSGELSKPAAAVRDGFLAGYYGEDRRRPEVRFYDTHGTVGGSLSAYEQAVSAGNDFVVGPLGREQVSALFGRAELPVPILALNRGTVAPPAGNASFRCRRKTKASPPRNC